MLENIEELTFDYRDEYERKPIADKVIKLLASEAKVSPMVIDGGWGTGKTEFCMKLLNLINSGEYGIKGLYIDAFKADHADEPLITLLSAVLKLLPEADRPGFMQKAVPAVKFGLKTSLKAGVSWILKQDTADVAEDFEKDLKKAGDEAVNYAVESILKEHVSADESISVLRGALIEIAKEKPIILFIDELDRCRPDFAVSMLESIKHIFEVDGVQFVLITNIDQLKASISNCYGSGVNAQKYIDKFIFYSFELPDKVNRKSHTPRFVSSKHIDDILKSNDVLSKSGLIKDQVSGFIYNLVEVNKLSLRETETFARYLEIYHTLSNEEGFQDGLYFGYYMLRILAVFVFCFNKDVAQMFDSKKVDIEAVAELLGKDALPGKLVEFKPNHEDMTISAIGLGAGFERLLMVPNLGDKGERWDGSMRHMFGDDGYENLNNVVKDVLDVLRLGI